MKQRDAILLVALMSLSASVIAVPTEGSEATGDNTIEAGEVTTSGDDVRMVGQGGGRAQGKIPVYGSYAHSEALALYTPDMLNLTAGEAIESIYVEGYVSPGSDIVGTDNHLRLGYAWVDDTTLEAPASADIAFDTSAINIVYDGNCVWEEKGYYKSATDYEYFPLVVMDFETPMVYEEGKSLLLYFSNERPEKKSGIYFDTNTANPKNAWTRAGNAPGVYDNNKNYANKDFDEYLWENMNVPPIHLVMADGPRNWSIASVSIPETAMQNKDVTGTLRVINHNKKDVEAGTYTVTAYVDDVPFRQQGEVVITASTGANDEGVEIPFTFRSPRVGKASVKVVLTADDDYTLETEPVVVEFEKEALKAEDKMVGQGGGRSQGKVPVYGSYAHSEALALYTPDMLNLTAGEAIKSIYVEGYVSENSAIIGTDNHLRLGYAWVDDTTLEAPASADIAFDTSAINIVYDGNCVWEQKGYFKSASDYEYFPLVVMDFETPIVYEEGKSLLLYFSNERPEKKSGIYFDTNTANPKNAWTRAGNAPGVYDNNKNYANKDFDEYLWENLNVPPIHLVMNASGNTLSGKVIVKGVGVKDAVISLVSTDGDNIQYEGVSDADGNYSIEVIQSERRYDMEAHTEGFAEYDEALDLSEGSVEKNINLRRIVRITDEGEHIGGDENAIVYFDKKLTAGYNVITLPISLTAEEVAEIFGENAKVFDYDKDIAAEDGVIVNFKDYTEELEAGHPYIIYVESETQEKEWRSRYASESLDPLEGKNLKFEVTSSPVELANGMIAMDESLIIEQEKEAPKAAYNAKAGLTLPAYSGYFVLDGNKNVLSVMFNGTLVDTSVETIVIDENNAHQIYDLNGYKVTNPSKGIYVIDGKLILVK